MNTQTQMTVAPLVAFLAGLLAGKGVFGFDAGTWTVILGAVAGAVVTVWGAIATKKSTLVSTVAAMPEVTSVQLDKAAPGTAALSDATPANVIAK